MLSVPAQAASPIEGTWRTLNGTEVAITPCGGSFCGTLSYVVIPQDYSAMCNANKEAFGAAMVDDRNPNRSLKRRPVIGLQMLEARATRDPNAYAMTVYNVETGETQEGTIWVDKADTLKIGGCMGPICGVAQEWPKVPTRSGPPDFSCG